jgi:hypothetical protein
MSMEPSQFTNSKSDPPTECPFPVCPDQEVLYTHLPGEPEGMNNWPSSNGPTVPAHTGPDDTPIINSHNRRDSELMMKLPDVKQDTLGSATQTADAGWFQRLSTVICGISHSTTVAQARWFAFSCLVEFCFRQPRILRITVNVTGHACGTIRRLWTGRAGRALSGTLRRLRWPSADSRFQPYGAV